MNRLHAIVLPWLVCPAVAQGVEEVEPNDTWMAATRLPEGGQGYGAISVATDRDHFGIDLLAASDLRAMTGPGAGGQIGDTRLELFDVDGTTLLASNNDFTGRGWYSQVTVGNLPAGRYYVVVSGVAPATGSYVLDVMRTPPGHLVPPPPPPLTGVPEFAEDNDERTTPGGSTVTMCDATHAGVIVSGGGGAGWSATFGGGNDYDFYRLDLPAPARIVAETIAGSAAPAVADTVLHIVDSQFVRLAFDDDGGAGALSLLGVSVDSGIYYVVVNSFDVADVGNYRLDITCLPPLSPEPAAATFVAHPGGCPGTAGVPLLDTRVVSSFHGIRVERPHLGTEFCVDVTNVPPLVPLIGALGLVPLTPPLDLAALGAPGCRLEVQPVVTFVAVTDRNAPGHYWWCHKLPYARQLIGLPLEMQAAVLDPPANPLGIAVSNRATAVLGDL